MTDEELFLYEKLAEALESVQIQADHASTVIAAMREALKKTCPEFDKEFQAVYSSFLFPQATPATRHALHELRQKIAQLRHPK
jgi:hypothetical protein